MHRVAHDWVAGFFFSWRLSMHRAPCVDYQTCVNRRPGFKWTQLIQNYTQRCGVVITRPFQLEQELTWKHESHVPFSHALGWITGTIDHDIGETDEKLQIKSPQIWIIFLVVNSIGQHLFSLLIFLCCVTWWLRQHSKLCFSEGYAQYFVSCVIYTCIWTDHCCLGLCIQDRAEESRSQRETVPGYGPHCPLEG